MGGAVSSGRDNDELVDNLMGSNYIRTRAVEQVFRALDRADYLTRDAREQAYKDMAWKNDLLHLSAPCIYCEVMENLELKPGLSFLNVGSGTGYLSTLVGLILGAQGISHGVELHPSVVQYANKRLGKFMENSPTLDEFDFCEPKFYVGNALCLAPLATPYDRVYCGAFCPSEYVNYFKQLIKIGGVLVMPLEGKLLQVRRVAENKWRTRTVLKVSYSTLSVPTEHEAANLIRLDEQSPVRLQSLARGAVRAALRGAVRARHPELRAAPARAPPAKKACPRRIRIPIDDDSDVEGLSVLHDLQRDTGASEMNALLSFMLSMGRGRAAGAPRADSGDEGGGGSPDVELEGSPPPDDSSDQDPDSDSDERPRGCGLITLDFRDILGEGAGDTVRAEVQSARAAGSARTATDNTRTDGEDPLTDGEDARTGGEDAQMESENARMGGGNVRTEDDNARIEDENARTEDESESDNAQVETGDAQGSSSGVRRSDARKARRGSGDSRDERRRRSSDDKASSDSVAGECSRTDTRDSNDDPDVPAEVEIYLGKTPTSEAGPSTWSMEWEEGAAPEGSSDDESRQKDSGLGASTPGKSDSDDDRGDSLSDDGVDVKATERRRRAPRPARAAPGAARRGKRRAAGGGDARRARLSRLMKLAVRDLPLPPALKMYVNLNRCYEF